MHHYDIHIYNFDVLKSSNVIQLPVALSCLRENGAFGVIYAFAAFEVAGWVPASTYSLYFVTNP